MFSRLRSNIVVLWIVRLLALPVIVLLYVAGFVLNMPNKEQLIKQVEEVLNR